MVVNQWNRVQDKAGETLRTAEKASCDGKEAIEKQFSTSISFRSLLSEPFSFVRPEAKEVIWIIVNTLCKSLVIFKLVYYIYPSIPTTLASI